ncbi:MAG: hypothetical protein RRC07_07340 [Anaerolineae bacterium]|nr:hypothetical protein [Anaerolineae bacterium]
MTQEATDFSASAEIGEETDAPPEILCSCSRAAVEHTCLRCQRELCALCTYREENGTLTYCRDCANTLVGVCDICDALHAKPCHQCGTMVCDGHQTQITKRWGWGGRSGQGGVLEWFPMKRTYCPEHGQGRVDKPRPAQRFSGFDGSSPEW